MGFDRILDEFFGASVLVINRPLFVQFIIYRCPRTKIRERGKDGGYLGGRVTLEIRGSMPFPRSNRFHLLYMVGKASEQGNNYYVYVGRYYSAGLLKCQ